uniref:Uncharacterized protein n=1 Tax=Ceratitis capitata TaxID=7213 RepID=W8BNQ1_CERCA
MRPILWINGWMWVGRPLCCHFANEKHDQQQQQRPLERPQSKHHIAAATVAHPAPATETRRCCKHQQIIINLKFCFQVTRTLVKYSLLTATCWSTHCSHVLQKKKKFKKKKKIPEKQFTVRRSEIFKNVSEINKISGNSNNFKQPPFKQSAFPSKFR